MGARDAGVQDAADREAVVTWALWVLACSLAHGLALLALGEWAVSGL